MKAIHYFSIIILVLNFSTTNAQNLFLIGSKTYKSSETFKMKSKSYGGHDLDVLIAKDSENGLLVLTTDADPIAGVRIKGDAIIYLDDGTVVTCKDRNKFDHVDDVVSTIYNLTKLELEKMKKSNINSIRFFYGCYNCIAYTGEGSFTAVNITEGYFFKKTDFRLVISELFY